MQRIVILGAGTVALMDRNKIERLVVADERHRVCGVVSGGDLLKLFSMKWRVRRVVDAACSGGAVEPAQRAAGFDLLRCSGLALGQALGRSRSIQSKQDVGP